ncbi:relaxin-3 [Suncus etruscus]|uniref:relaxin-3 n=1 Tax=Suncus etruscus TaxID=109475 RepID=UPI0021106B7E|nr:relaxin-3 [Suncus etruscus]
MSGAGSINAVLECSRTPTLEAATLPTMARRLLLLPPLVLLLLAAGTLVVEAEESQNRMKLCGRDFVRTIIFICGSSRWKRSPIGRADVEEPEEPDPDWESIDEATKDITKGWPSVLEMPQPRRGRHASPERGGLSKYCCKKGCTMKDISNYC